MASDKVSSIIESIEALNVLELVDVYKRQVLGLGISKNEIFLDISCGAAKPYRTIYERILIFGNQS